MVNRTQGKELLFKSIKKVAIIEPHYDDAWINLGGTILNHPEIEFKIISVSVDELNNKNETKRLEGILPNVKTETLNYRGLSIGEKTPPCEWKEEFCKLNDLKNFEELSQKVQSMVENSDLALLPLGLNHPQHILVSEIKLSKPVRYYREFPYYFPSMVRDYRKFFYHLKGKWRHHIRVYLTIRDTTESVLDISQVLKEKNQIFKEVYKGQLAITCLDKHRYKLSKLRKEVLYGNANVNRRLSPVYLYLKTLTREFSYPNFIDIIDFSKFFFKKLLQKIGKIK